MTSTINVWYYPFAMYYFFFDSRVPKPNNESVQWI